MSEESWNDVDLLWNWSNIDLTESYITALSTLSTTNTKLSNFCSNNIIEKIHKALMTTAINYYINKYQPKVSDTIAINLQVGYFIHSSF